jgi:hypothetical protein
MIIMMIMMIIKINKFDYVEYEFCFVRINEVEKYLHTCNILIEYNSSVIFTLLK